MVVGLAPIVCVVCTDSAGSFRVLRDGYAQFFSIILFTDSLGARMVRGDEGRGSNSDQDILAAGTVSHFIRSGFRIRFYQTNINYLVSAHKLSQFDKYFFGILNILFLCVLL